MLHFSDLRDLLAFLRKCKGTKKPEKIHLFRTVTISASLLKDVEAARQVFEVSGDAIMFFSDAIRNDFDLVLTAAKKNISALLYAGDAIRSDPICGRRFLDELGSGAFSYLLKGATGNLDLCWYCFIDLNDAHQLDRAPLIVRKNETFALKLLSVKGKGWALDLFHKSIWNNLDLLTLAFEHSSLIYANKVVAHVERDPALFRALIEKCPVALQAFPNSWNNIDYVLAAIKKGWRVCPAHPILATHFPKNMEVLEYATEACPENLQLAEDADDAFMSRVIIRNAACAKYIPRRLLNDFGFMAHASSKNWRLLPYLKKDFIKPRLCVRIFAQCGAAKFLSDSKLHLEMKTLRFATERVESYKVQMLILCAAKPKIRIYIEETSWKAQRCEMSCPLQILQGHGPHFFSNFMKKISQYAALAGLKECRVSETAKQQIQLALAEKPIPTVEEVELNRKRKMDRQQEAEENERVLFAKFGL